MTERVNSFELIILSLKGKTDFFKVCFNAENTYEDFDDGKLPFKYQSIYA